MTSVMSHTRTDEQSAIIAAARDTDENLLIRAYAGCGKSSTLQMITNEIEKAPILYIAFAKRNAEDAAGQMPSNVAARTINSVGHRVWADRLGTRKLSLSDKKIGRIFREVADGLKGTDREDMWNSYHDIVTAVALAKAHGYVPAGKYPTAKHLIETVEFNSTLDEPLDDWQFEIVDTILHQSIQEAFSGTMDFNDQVYMPAVFGGPFPRFPLVMVDEFQDLSPVNHVIVNSLFRKRLICVGDEYQNIYRFRGATAGGMYKAKEKYSMRELPLSISFRCPEAIVNHARHIVPDFKSMKPGGEVLHPSAMSLADFPYDSTILCRLNAPLFALALRLLASGHSVHVVGRDIGPRLVKIMSKLGPETMSQASTLLAIADWEAARVAAGSATAPDMAACMTVFVNATTNLGQAIQYANHLFKQEGHIRLMTGHKSKGDEFDNVYHLDPHLCGKGQQGKNLWYVITTRSRKTLTEIQSTNIGE